MRHSQYFDSYFECFKEAKDVHLYVNKWPEDGLMKLFTYCYQELEVSRNHAKSHS